MNFGGSPASVRSITTPHADHVHGEVTRVCGSHVNVTWAIKYLSSLFSPSLLSTYYVPDIILSATQGRLDKKQITVEYVCVCGGWIWLWVWNLHEVSIFSFVP